MRTAVLQYHIQQFHPLPSGTTFKKIVFLF